MKSTQYTQYYIPTYTKSCEACLDPKLRNKAKELVKLETWEAYSEKKLTNARSERLQKRLKPQYKETNKQVKRMVRADQRFYAENLAAQAEETAAKKSLGRYKSSPSLFVASTALN